MEEIKHGKQACCNNCTFFDHPEGYKWSLCKLYIPDEECNDDDETYHKHSYIGPLRPSIAVLRTGQGQWDKCKTEPNDKEQRADKVEFRPCNMNKMLRRG
ncbi:hypothetical protein TruAng_012009 [Truncatella angustata]|nr:hypothetical protein TruAng_012009 [Truncatella angustata]